jgi:hypothetical protein
VKKEKDGEEGSKVQIEGRGVMGICRKKVIEEKE